MATIQFSSAGAAGFNMSIWNVGFVMGLIANVIGVNNSTRLIYSDRSKSTRLNSSHQ